MFNANKLFANEKNGYQKAQVDNYISKISEAYQAAYSDNQALQEMCNTRIEDYKKLAAAEMLAQKIIKEAQAEAERMKAEAEEIINEAFNEAARIVAWRIQEKRNSNETNETKETVEAMEKTA